MKLLLTSGGFSNKGIINNSIVSALKELAGKPFSSLNLAFVPTASNMEEGDKWWLIEDLEVLKKLEFKEIDIVDISALPQKIWQKRLGNADILLFEGGNTYHLMYWINKSGLKDVLQNLLKDKVYVGISAGSIVATPSLILSSAEKEPLKEIGEEIYDEGLKMVDFLIEPHINSQYFPELTFDYVEQRAKNIPYCIYALDDNSAVKVLDNTISIISKGKWKKFN